MEYNYEYGFQKERQKLSDNKISISVSDINVYFEKHNHLAEKYYRGYDILNGRDVLEEIIFNHLNTLVKTEEEIMEHKAHRAKPQYYFGEQTPYHKLANDLMANLEYSGVLSNAFLSYIYTSLINMIYYHDHNDLANGKQLYSDINDFLDRYSLFSDSYKSTVRRPFLLILNSIEN